MKRKEIHCFINDQAWTSDTIPHNCIFLTRHCLLMALLWKMLLLGLFLSFSSSVFVFTYNRHALFPIAQFNTTPL